jgi:hypothetical protein
MKSRRMLEVFEHEELSNLLREANVCLEQALEVLGGHRRLQNKLLRARAEVLDAAAWLQVELVRDHRNGHHLKIYNWDISTEKLPYQSPPTIYVVGEEKPKTLQDLYKRSDN